MKTPREIAVFLSQNWKKKGLKIGEVATHTGLTRPTIRGLLEAKKDSKLTTLLAIADELGLEVVLVPKAVAQSIAPAENNEAPQVETLIGSALKRTAPIGSALKENVSIGSALNRNRNK